MMKETFFNHLKLRMQLKYVTGVTESRVTRFETRIINLTFFSGRGEVCDMFGAIQHSVMDILTELDIF